MGPCCILFSWPVRSYCSKTVAQIRAVCGFIGINHLATFPPSIADPTEIHTFSGIASSRYFPLGSPGPE